MSPALLCVALWLLFVTSLLLGRYPGEDWLDARRRRRAADVGDRPPRCRRCASLTCSHAAS